MTTAKTGVVKEDGVTPTDAFDDGSGRVDLASARNPLFTIDETGANYTANATRLYATNYPSLYVPALSGALTVSRTLKSVTGTSREYKVSVSAPSDLRVRVSTTEFTLRPGASRTLAITVDGRDVPLGQTRFATVTFRSGARTFTFPVTVVRRQGPVEVTKTCDPGTVAKDASTTCTVTMTNQTAADATVTMRDDVPSNLRVTPGSVVGGTSVRNRVTATVTIPAKLAPQVAVADEDPALTPGGGYLPLSAFGIAPIAGVDDETISNFTVPSFTLAGVTYSRIGLVSDGYVVLGGGTSADIQFVNTALPNPARPNNIVAPFWSDLNPAFGGSLRIGTLTDGVSRWVIADFEDVAEFSNPTRTHSFQVWIQVGGAEDVTVVYGPTQPTAVGDGGFATVGVENPDGTNGHTLYLDGVGTLPAEGTAHRVTGTPGKTFSATVSFAATGRNVGPWVNYAEVTGPFDGTAIARFAGTVTR